MLKRFSFMSLLLLAALLAGCVPNPATTTPLAPTAVVIPQFPTTPATETTAAQPSPSATPTAPAVSVTAPSPSGGLPGYLDDRSDPAALVRSLFNAITRKEYARAYTYWRSPADTYEQFKQGYASTGTVDVTTGPVSGDAGAGQFYYTVPVVIQAQTTAGQMETYSGCYVLHLSNPGIQAEPPFHPLAIERGTLSPAASSTDPAALLASACQGEPQSPTLAPSPSPSPDDISAGFYIDNRSDAVSVLRSLFNAVNRKEYARAYSYWKTGSGVAPFDQFEAGYAGTEKVDAAFGQPVEDAGVGQLRWLVPVALKVQTTQGATQTFQGCYQLHLSQPAVQDMVPFQPLAIEKVRVTQLTPTDDPTAGLDAACDTMP